MAELTEEEKQRMYLNPILDTETQLLNEIEGFNRLISEAKEFVSEIENVNQAKFLSEHYITFHDKRITDKDLIKKFYKILVSDWHYKIDSAKKELSILKGDPLPDKEEDTVKEDEEPDNIEPKKKKRFKIFEILDNILSRVPKVVETIDTIKGKK